MKNSPFDRVRVIALSAAMGVALFAPPSMASEDDASAAPKGSDSMTDFSQEAEQMSEAAKDAIEKFAVMIEPILESFARVIEDMPRYETPEVLPNGDILIRRVQKDEETRIDDQADSTTTDL